MQKNDYEELDTSMKIVGKFWFMSHQLQLIDKAENRRRYPPELYALSAALHTNSSSAYR